MPKTVTTATAVTALFTYLNEYLSVYFQTVHSQRVTSLSLHTLGKERISFNITE